MSEWEKGTRCPHCGQHHDVVSSSREGDNVAPEDGDFSLCITCGNWLVFASQAAGGARLPNVAEEAILRGDYFRDVHNAWCSATVLEIRHGRRVVQ